MTNVDIQAVAKSYGPTPVLSDISIHFEEGTFTSLLGSSGSGKTTLLRCVAGFVTPDHGGITIGGRDVTRTPVWARNIGMVFQSYALFPHMSVAENVAFGLARRGIRGSEASTKVTAALDMVRLSGYGDRRTRQLSGGQQQRVALARAIVTRPSVLLLDEPLSALDRKLRQEMQMELLRIQRESGLTTIFVTHDQEEALTLSDKLAILDRGRIVQIGAPADVYEHPQTRFAAAFLGDSNFLEGTVRDGAIDLAGGATIRSGGELPSVGTTVTLAIRPEKMTLHSAGATIPDTENRLSARITAAIYGGPTLTYTARSAEGYELKVYAMNSDGNVFPIGSDVMLSWSPRHTIVVSG